MYITSCTGIIACVFSAPTIKSISSPRLKLCPLFPDSDDFCITRRLIISTRLWGTCGNKTISEMLQHLFHPQDYMLISCVWIIIIIGQRHSSK